MDKITPQAWQYGVLGVVALVFGYAILHLFKALRADQAITRAVEVAREKERGEWAAERERMRGEYEERHREVVESYANALRAERAENRVHEDLVRKEFAELMEQVSSEASKSSQALVDMLQKFYDRLVGPRRR